LAAKGHRFGNVADIGTGTGLLAFAARHLWPGARIIASDIDPVSIRVAADNARTNQVPTGHAVGQVALVTASGTDHPRIRRRARYDLIIANILAGPLIELAPAFAALLADGGSLILAGLLDRQVDAVKQAYAVVGIRLAETQPGGDWPCLRLIKRTRHGWRRPARASGRTSQAAGDFGTW
jgi:ribosomal protein L11 methyltransferase